MCTCFFPFLKPCVRVLLNNVEQERGFTGPNPLRFAGLSNLSEALHLQDRSVRPYSLSDEAIVLHVRRLLLLRRSVTQEIRKSLELCRHAAACDIHADVLEKRYEVDFY
jgi:hypothetical protein